MSCIEYLLPSSVSGITSQELNLIECNQCKQVAFRPVMCQCCKNLYCQFHKFKCLKGGQLRDEISPTYASIFMNLTIKCSCTESLFAYPVYLGHKSKCPKPKFKLFCLVLEDGSKLGLSEVDSASIHFNLLRRNHIFVLGSYQFNMEEMKCRVEESKAIKSQEDKQCFSLAFHQQNPKRQAFWFMETPQNPYKPYQSIYQQQIEDSYDNYLSMKSTNSLTDPSSNTFMGIDFSAFLSFGKHRVIRETV